MILTNAAISGFMSPIRQTISPSESVAVAGRYMKEHKVNHLPVMEGTTLVGIVSALDLLRISPEERESSPVLSVMSREVETIAPDMTVRALLNRIREVSYNAFPVVRDGELVGMITTSDLEHLLYRDF